MIARVVRGHRWRLAAVVALAVGGVLAGGPARSQDGDGACRITGGYGAVFHDVPSPAGFGYRGVIILRTRSCGDGARGVSGSFAPVGGGTPASCTPVETPRIDESRCEFSASLGFGTAGMPVVIRATAHTSGVFNDHVHDDDTVERLQESRIQPGAEVKSSECVVALPEDGGRFACSLF